MRFCITRWNSRGTPRARGNEAGSRIGNSAGGWDLYVGVCVGSTESTNPAASLPWKDVRVPQTAGFVLELDFVLDHATIPAAGDDG